MIMTSQYQPGNYVKGDRSRFAETKADAVAAVFDGFVLEGPALEDTDYRDLQEQAKAAGIPANQSKEALVSALASPADDETVEVTSDLGKGDGSVPADADPGASGGAAGLFS